MHDFIAFLNKLRFIGQAVIDQLKFLFRYFNSDLEWPVPHSQTVIQKVLMGTVSSPQLIGYRIAAFHDMIHRRISLP